MVSRFLLVTTPPLFIFQDAKRLSFDKPGDTKREDRDRFEPEDRMQWSEPRGDWQVRDKRKKGSKHNTGENNDTTDQVDRVSLLLSRCWVHLIRSPKKKDRHQSQDEEKAGSKRNVRQPNCHLSLSGTQ